MITLDQLAAIFNTTSRSRLMPFIEWLNKTMVDYSINTLNREAAFIAQVGYESSEFTTIEENLNYSEQRLLAVFPNYFNQSNVGPYDHNPEKIANRVYANRDGNGNEASGDGWKYHGRGLIQITGKANYQSFANEINSNLTDTISTLQTAQGAVYSAGWFWDLRKCNPLADTEDIATMTRRINGGVNGLDQRIALYNKGKTIIK